MSSILFSRSDPFRVGTPDELVELEIQPGGKMIPAHPFHERFRPDAAEDRSKKHYFTGILMKKESV